MTAHDTSSTDVGRTTTLTSGRLLLLSALGFLLFYVAVSFITPAFAGLRRSRCPTTRPRRPARWFVENPFAAVMIGVCQVASVACLAGFVGALGRAPPVGLRRGRADGALQRRLLAADRSRFGRPPRHRLRPAHAQLHRRRHRARRGAQASTCGSPRAAAGSAAAYAGWPGSRWWSSVASLVSLVVYEGAALILLGRLLCMIWTVSAAVSASRAMARGTWLLRNHDRSLARRGGAGPGGHARRGACAGRPGSGDPVASHPAGRASPWTTPPTGPPWWARRVGPRGARGGRAQGARPEAPGDRPGLPTVASEEGPDDRPADRRVRHHRPRPATRPGRADDPPVAVATSGRDPSLGRATSTPPTPMTRSGSSAWSTT